MSRESVPSSGRLTTVVSRLDEPAIATINLAANATTRRQTTNRAVYAVFFDDWRVGHGRGLFLTKLQFRLHVLPPFLFGAGRSQLVNIYEGFFFSIICRSISISCVRVR
jgi:hypothetical protein